MNNKVKDCRNHFSYIFKGRIKAFYRSYNDIVPFTQREKGKLEGRKIDIEEL
jgi:hypothetical protein